MSEQGYPLPDAWIETSLGKVIQYGATEKAEPDTISNETWVLELEDVEKETSKILSRRTFSDRKSKSAKNRFSAGDVLYGKLRPYLNKIVIAKESGVCTTEILPLKPNGVVHGGFLFYWLKHPIFLDYVKAVSYGVNMPRLSTADGKAAPFILAPLAEQKRIADKLDTVLVRVDACRERLDRVPLILNRFRQSVLAAATSGELTIDWRAEKNDAPWENVKLGELLREKPRNGYSPQAVDFETQVRSLALSATTYGKFRGEYFKFIDEKIPVTSHLWLRPGDILIQRANSLEYVGVSAIFDGPPDRFIYPDLMMKCRANDRIETTYLYFVLSAEKTRNFFRVNATGTAGNMPKINQQTVLSVPVSLPLVAEQQEIVRRVETLFAFADRLEARLATARAATDRLTPALLAKAFRGELVPQDPNDEPASELLKRLAAQREAAPKTARGRKAAAI